MTTYIGDDSWSTGRTARSYTQGPNPEARQPNSSSARPPTPPASNRPSFEGGIQQPAQHRTIGGDSTLALDCSPSPIARHRLSTPPPSPPCSQIVEDIINQVRDAVTRGIEYVTIKQVTTEVYELVSRKLTEQWEGVRMDLHNDVLYITCTITPEHEIISEVFHQLIDQRTFSPRKAYQGITIMSGGSTTVRLVQGSKEPDFSLYEVVEEQRSSTPTIVFEVARSESEEKLSLDAARLLCLTKGKVKLVVAVKIHLDQEKAIELVTWSHWEIVRAETVETVERAPRLNDPRATEFREGIPVKYAAFCKVGNDALIKFTAANVATHQIYPQLSGAHSEEIQILYRHLYRDPLPEDENKIAFIISHQLVRDVIKKANLGNQKGKRKYKPDSDDDDAYTLRFVQKMSRYHED